MFSLRTRRRTSVPKSKKKLPFAGRPTRGRFSWLVDRYGHGGPQNTCGELFDLNNYIVYVCLMNDIVYVVLSNSSNELHRVQVQRHGHVFPYLYFVYLAGGIFETCPRAKFQIWQESVLSPIGSPWAFWTNRLHQSASFFGARLFGWKKRFGFGTVQKCHKFEIHHLAFLYLAGYIETIALRN